MLDGPAQWVSLSSSTEELVAVFLHFTGANREIKLKYKASKCII